MPYDRVDHFPMGIAWEGWPPFGEKLTDVNENYLQKSLIHSLKNQDVMIKSKPIGAIKLNVSKNLLTMLVNYSIFNFTNDLPWECDFMQHVLPIPTVLQV